MEHDGYYQLGTITRTHGVKGNVVIRLDVDQPAAYRKLKAAFLFHENRPVEIKVTSASVSGEFLNVHLEGVDDMDAAEKLINTEVFLPLHELPKLKGNKLYFHEAVGMQVSDEKNGLIGTIQKVYDLPEQPVASVDFNGKELLFPLIPEFIVSIDREKQVLYVNLPDGLTEIYR